jgi:23S rRNA (uridine2552-2'-O)-methyltransferase
MAKRTSSARWLAEHHSDEFVKRARELGYRSRAVFKLEELDERHRLLRPGMTVVDLGAAPGGWCQYAAKRLGRGGRIIALDILPMEAVPGVEFIEGDFREEAVLERLKGVLAGCGVDLVMSDMAPNMSGMRDVDVVRAAYLCELALDVARESLKPGGAMVMKAFIGSGFDEMVRAVRSSFARVAVRKPKASRNRSAETYLVATGFRPA